MPAVHRLLAADEELLVEARPHWVFVTGPLLLTALALVLAIAVVVSFPGAPVAVGWLLVAMVIVPALWLAGRYARWRGIRLLVTTQRLVYRRGVLGRRVTQLRLRRIAEVHYAQTLPERLVGCGRVVLELVDERPMVIDHVRGPRALQRLITAQLGDPDTPPYGTLLGRR